uniref:Uncharacterized protein n=1 Tax=Aureoumbra lagunensis TaxID=44058 RepID=A0A7S3NMM4_9STRA
MGSFDELITPFLMDSHDSHENFEFDESHGRGEEQNVAAAALLMSSQGAMHSPPQAHDAPVQNAKESSKIKNHRTQPQQSFTSEGGNYSFDGLHVVDDLHGLFTHSNGLDVMTSMHSLPGFMPSLSAHASSQQQHNKQQSSRDKVEENDDAPRANQQEEIDDQEEEVKALPRRRYRKKKAETMMNEDDIKSSERRKQMYVDYLKEHQRKNKNKNESSKKRQKIKGRSLSPPAVPPPPISSRGWSVDENDADIPSLMRAIALQFLYNRTHNIVDRERWKDILVTSNFRLVLPRESYRVAYGSPTARSTHTICGIDGIIRDTRSMAAMVEMIRACCLKMRITNKDEASVKKKDSK